MQLRVTITGNDFVLPMQDFNTALKSYVRKMDKDITKLHEYAKLFRVEKLIKAYLEALL